MDTPTSSPSNIVTPTRPFAISSTLRFPILERASDKTSTAADNFIIVVEAVPKLLSKVPILLNIAIEPTSSPNNVVIPIIAFVNFSGSIAAIPAKDKASIPIALAIFISVSA